MISYLVFQCIECSSEYNIEREEAHCLRSLLNIPNNATLDHPAPHFHFIHFRQKVCKCFSTCFLGCARGSCLYANALPTLRREVNTDTAKASGLSIMMS